MCLSASNQEGLGVVEFRLLGDVEVWHGDRQIALGSKQRAVLVVLLYQANTVVGRSEIIRLAWGSGPDDAPATIHGLVADYVSHLRTALRAAGAGDGQVRLVARQPGYLIQVDTATVDWHRFRALLTEARTARQTASVEDAARLLRRALGLWRGPALADLPRRSLDPIREQMNERRLAAAEDLARIELDRGAPDGVIDLLTELAAAHPARERLAALLVRALNAAGRRDEAVAVYQRTRTYLQRELGLDPSRVLAEAYQLILADDRAGPARSEPTTRPAQLPLDTSNFTGRATELDHLLALVATTPTGGASGVVAICAVDGMAGVGKTALAVHAAHRLATRFPDGCLFLDLHGYTEQVPQVAPGQALDRLLRAMGVPGEQIPSHLDDQAALYRDRLAGKRMLILLDNARTAEQVRPLLPAAPGCLVLVTSRRRLTALDEDRPLSLDILPVDDAATLFARIAGAARVTGDTDAVDRVIRLCGRLPLAIRIAAARLRVRPAWTVGHLADRLADQHATLGELDDGERSIAAAFTLSYRDLSGDQQRMFRLLGLHPGTDTDPYAAAALAATTPARANRLLEDLLDAHLLIQAEAGRYRFHDLVRAYAAHLAHTEDAEEERRVALTGLFDHYLATTAAAMDARYPAKEHHRPRIGPADSPTPQLTDPGTALAWLDAERPNLVAACAHTATHGWPGHTTRLATTLYRYLDGGGHYPDALTIHSHARHAAARTGDRVAEAQAVTNLGLVHWRQSRYPQAAEHHEQALTLYRETGDRAGEARTLANLGLVHWRQSRLAEAAEHLQQALTLYRETGDRGGEANALSNLGLIHWRQGRYRQAAEHHRQALALYRETGRRFGEANALANLSVVDWRQGRLAEAAEHIQQALTRYRETGNRLGAAYALVNLGVVYARQGRHAEAAEHLQQALAFFRETGHRTGDGYALGHLGDVYRRQGRYAEAAEHLQQALTHFRETGDRTGEAEALNGIGETLTAAGHPDQAGAQHTAALTLAIQTGDRYEQARAHTGLAHADHTTGENDQARRHWQEALARYVELGVPDAEDVRSHLAALDRAAASDADGPTSARSREV